MVLCIKKKNNNLKNIYYLYREQRILEQDATQIEFPSILADPEFL